MVSSIRKICKQKALETFTENEKNITDQIIAYSLRLFAGRGAAQEPCSVFGKFDWFLLDSMNIGPLTTGAEYYYEVISLRLVYSTTFTMN